MPTSKKVDVRKSKPPRKIKALFIVGGAIVICLLALFLFRGWVRATVIPKTTSLFYLSEVTSTLDSQSKDLSNPLSTLGFTNITKSNTCNLELAQSYRTEVDCQTSNQSYIKLPATATGLNNEMQRVTQLQSSLTAQGWHAGSNGVTLTSLVGGIIQHKDYSPDANYEKIINRNDCVFDVMIAYSNPQPPALRATFSCDRTVDVLGTPNGQFYDSAKGHM